MAVSPTDYAFAYHSLRLNYPDLKLVETVNIQRYQNGPRPECTAERDAMLDLLAPKLGLRNRYQIPPVFTMPAGPGFDGTESFYLAGIRRAYGGKGSPSEIADALRLAWACRRNVNGKGGPRYPSATRYAYDFLGLDCNGFVGNYFGLSPEFSVQNWGTNPKADVMKWDEGKRRAQGFGPMEMAMLQYFPLQPRTEIQDVQDLDILISVGIHDGKYHHIAVVDDVQALSNDTKGAVNMGWTIVEWGWWGDRYEHVKQDQWAALVPGKDPKKGLVFQDGDRWRYVFASPCEPFPADFGRCGFDTL
jgi:hypothetical protein